jgi:hypothetical protein
MMQHNRKLAIKWYGTTGNWQSNGTKQWERKQSNGTAQQETSNQMVQHNREPAIKW